MEGEVDDGHLNLDIDETCQPSRVNKKLDNPDDESHDEEIDIEDQNPFQIQVILDVLFNKLPFEEVKEFRLVSTTWNEVGSSELFRRPQKPIRFDDLEDFGDDDKLDELIKLQKSHDLFFPTDYYKYQLFSNISINIALLWTDDQVTSPIFDNFFDIFKPSFVHLYGCIIYNRNKYREEEEEKTENRMAHNLCKFLVKISPTIQEIDFSDFHIEFMYKERVVDDVVEELTRTSFPNLRKISKHTILQKMFFYPIIGQNSAKLNHLSFGSSSSFVSARCLYEELTELKALFESNGLMSSKFKKLSLLDVGAELLDLFADFGQRGLLKLTKLNFKYDKFNSEVRDIFVRLLASQCDSLKILNISTSYQKTMVNPPPNTIIEPYPRLKNLTILQIDHFSTFQTFFEPIDFSLQFPKLEEFRTFDFDTFYKEDFGKGGDSVKFVSFLGHQSTGPGERDFDKIYEIFPNLEILEVDISFLPYTYEREFKENAPFWSRLRKLRIHCSGLEDLFNFYLHEHLLKDVKKIEVVMDCGNTLANEDSYKKSLSDQFKVGFGDLDQLRREKLYQKSLKIISEQFCSIIHVTSISITGYKISEEFKRDFRSIFLDCTFVSRKFKYTRNY